MLKINAIIQARMNSSRLPGKVLLPILDKPLLIFLYERLSQSILLDNIIVATSVNKCDDRIYDICKKNKIKVYRGSEENVLKRVYDTASKYKTDILIEIFADSPFIDSFFLDQFIGYFLKNIDKIDILTNIKKTTYPPGFEIIVYKKKCIEYAEKNTSINDPLREHPSQNILNQQKFLIENIEAPKHLNYPDYYFEIDSKDDYEMINKLTKKCNEEKLDVNIFNLIRILNHNPMIANINKNVKRKWKKFRV